MSTSWKCAIPFEVLSSTVATLMDLGYKVSALRLIRACYTNAEGQYMNLHDARIILGRVTFRDMTPENLTSPVENSDD